MSDPLENLAEPDEIIVPEIPDTAGSVSAVEPPPVPAKKRPSRAKPKPKADPDEIIVPVDVIERANAAAAAPNYRIMSVVGVTQELPSPFPLIELQEAENPYRTISMPVGAPEGVAIAHALRKIPTPRPLTHEVWADMLRRFAIDIVAVRIVGRLGGTYFAELDMVGKDRRVVLSIRPSDGFALILRNDDGGGMKLPLLLDERLFEAGDVAPPED